MSRARARELALPVLLVVVILVAALGAALALHGAEAKRRREVVHSRQERAGIIVDAAFHAPLDRLAQVAAGVEAGSSGAPDSWRTLTRQMLSTPEVGAVAYVERVTERERPRWEREHRLVIRATPAPSSAPAPARPVHYVVRSVIAKTPVTPGTDIGTDATRLSALRRATSLGEATFTPPVSVFGQDGAQTSLLVAIQPVEIGALGTHFATASLAFDRLAASLQRTLPTGTSVTIDDAGARLVKVGRNGGSVATRHLRLGGRELRVRTSVIANGGTAWDVLVLLAGLLVALAVGGFVGATRRREASVSAQAGERLAERRVVEADLDRERGFSATLIAALPDGFVASDNRGIIVVNDALCKLTGFSRRELMGRLFPHGFWPEDALTEIQRLRDHAAETGSAEGEAMLRTKDDERVPVLVSTSRVEGTHGPVEVSLVRDNREGAEARRRLTESEAQLRSLANAATDMVVRLSRSERIEWASPSSEHVLGYAPEELAGRHFSELFEREGLGKLNAEAGVYRLQRKDGRVIWAETTVAPTIDEAGGLTGMRSSIRDVSEREQVRAELQRAHGRYRRLAELLPDTIVLMADAQQRFTLAAGGGLEAAERESSELEGRTVAEVLTASAQQQHLLPFWTAAFGGRGGELTYTSDVGREYLVRFLPLTTDAGDPDGVMVVATDVTLVRARSAQPDAV